MLLESGADPNVPLGKGAGNAVCTLTTNKAHRSRSSVAVTATLSLLHKLILAGADIFAKVMLAKGKVGTVMDFAHVAFQSVGRYGVHEVIQASVIKNGMQKLPLTDPVGGGGIWVGILSSGNFCAIAC